MNISYIYGKIMKKLRGACIIHSSVDASSTIYSGTDLINSTVGKYTYIGYDCHIDRTHIGSYCSISDHVFVGGAEHPMHWASTSPMFQNIGGSGTSKRFARFDVEVFKDTYIGNDVWIGHGVTIKTGVKIGNGAIIGSGAVVTKDVAPYAIVAGVPAKVIKYRFSPEIIQGLSDSVWWELDDKQMAEVGKFVKDIPCFIEAIEKVKNAH